MSGDKVAAGMPDDEILRELEPHERAARGRVLRRWIWVFGTVFAVISFGLVGFVIVVLRDKPANACEQLLSPLTEVEQLVGGPLRFEGGVGGDRDCELVVREGDPQPRLGTPIVTIKNQHAARYDSLRRQRSERFAIEKPFAVATGEAVLFVADGRDGARHVVLFVHDDVLTELELEPRVFTAERAQALTAIVARHAQP